MEQVISLFPPLHFPTLFASYGLRMGLNRLDPRFCVELSSYDDAARNRGFGALAAVW